MMEEKLNNRSHELINIINIAIANPFFINEFYSIKDTIEYTILNGGKLYFCGNGGSYADCMHIAAEFTGRFNKDRNPYPAEVIGSNGAYLTAVANDYSYDDVYSRYLEAFLKPKDIVIGISTSGTSPNVVHALIKAQEMGNDTILVCGNKNNTIKTDHKMIIPSANTAQIQVAYLHFFHVICELIDGGK